MGELTWSRDGTRIYDFDGSQIFEFDVLRKLRTDLTAYRIDRRTAWPDYLPTGSPTRFHLDRPRQRLLYLSYRWKESMETFTSRLVALSLQDRKETILIDENTLPKGVLAHDLAPEEDRLYTREQWSLSVWTLAGKKLASIPLNKEEKGALVLSPDRRILIVERAIPPDQGPWTYKGFGLLDTRAHRLEPQIGWGHHFRWSPDGRQIAFLNKDNELWLFDVQTKGTRQLVVCDRSVTRDYAEYYDSPAWSPDGRMLSAFLSTYLGTPHDFAFHTIVVDFGTKELCCFPTYWIYRSWAPDTSVFQGQPDRRAQTRSSTEP